MSGSRLVSWQCYQYGEKFRIVYYSCMSLPTATNQKQLMHQQQQQQINQQPEQCYLNENQNCDDEDVTNLKPDLSFLLLLHMLFSAINQFK